MISAESMLLADFSETAGANQWTVVNDGVMGGLSQGRFTLNEARHGVFSGHVSLANNGGFSMVKCALPQTDVEGYSTAIIRLKGDGKRYQFRVKSDRADRHSYVRYFDTDGRWQTIEIPLSDLTPAYRGRRLDMPNYPAKSIQEIAFLAGNKKAEDFRLEIASVHLRR